MSSSRIFSSSTQEYTEHEEGRRLPDWKEVIMLVVGLISLIGWTFPFTAIIFGCLIRDFTDRFRIHLTVLLAYLLAVMMFHRVVPGGYPEWFCSLATPCYCLGHWLYHQSQQVIITPESS